ncbi:MAG: transcriptional repressor LexA [Coriobacteriales bacterium]|jgi:repressor LexA|nr:transcriptional repressor LexA [Coriobacteriales bacterium]
MEQRDDLSGRQQAILDFLAEFTAHNGYPPSVRQIGEAVGLSSSSTVHSHLNSLEAKGFIKRDADTARGLAIVGQEASDPASSASDPLRNIVMLPLVGQVAAGEPILAEQNVAETMALPAQIVGDSSSFMLTVRGDSMIEAGILDGDYVVVKEQASPNNGEIVVALIDDEATVKTFYREADRIRLQPENPTMEPIYVRDVTILGKVIALLRAL